MPERQIETCVEINASPKRVWRILTNFREMQGWNPFIRSISGHLAEGGRLSVSIAPPGKSGMKFKPTVLVLRPERELRWLGRVLLPGIFDGEHYFLLEPIEGSATRFTHGEKFSGALVGILGGTLNTTEIGFESMNKALKRRAEGTDEPE
jgi:hypothetical protein